MSKKNSPLFKQILTGTSKAWYTLANKVPLICADPGRLTSYVTRNTRILRMLSLLAHVNKA